MAKKYDVTLTVTVPLVIQDVKAESIYEAANLSQQLLAKTFPLVVVENSEKIAKEMIITLGDCVEK